MNRFLPLLLLCSMSFLGQSQSDLEEGAFVIETDNLLGPISDMQLLPNVGFAVTDRFVVRMGYSNILVTDGSYELENLGIAIGGKALLQNDLFVSIDLSASGTEFGSGNAFSDFDLAVAAQLECGRFIPINRSMYFALHLGGLRSSQETRTMSWLVLVCNWWHTWEFRCFLPTEKNQCQR